MRCSFSRSWAESDQGGELGKGWSLTGRGAGGQGWMQTCIAAPRVSSNADVHHSTSGEQHRLLSSSLALGSGCLIKCKHLNELSYSVDFLSVILAKLFALLPSRQAFQVN